MPYLARASAASVTITPPGNTDSGTGLTSLGPGRIRIYRINYGANVSSGTNGIRIQAIDDSGSVIYSQRHFPCPNLATGVTHSVSVIYDPGVVFYSNEQASTIAGVIRVTTTITGTAVTNPSIEVIYDFV